MTFTRTTLAATAVIALMALGGTAAAIVGVAGAQTQPTTPDVTETVPAPAPAVAIPDLEDAAEDAPWPGRHGALSERERALAEAAWSYFEANYHPETGLVNAVQNYPSASLWDLASYLGGLVAAYELGIIDKTSFDRRAHAFIATMRSLQLTRDGVPNKVYNTRTGERTDYTNAAGEIGFSGIDIGRMLIWLAIIKDRYPYLANGIDRAVMRWNFCELVDSGELHGSSVRDGEVVYRQEGRLGYEQYAAKGFGLWGFDMDASTTPTPYQTVDLFGVDVPFDGRDPRTFHAQNYVVTEGYVLDGIELNWDLPIDETSSAFVHTDGWRAEFAQRVYLAQQRRFETIGILTARSEHQIAGSPYFVYDSLFSNGYAWNTLTPRQEYVPDLAAVSAKAAVAMWALWDSDYTDLLFDAVAELTPAEGNGVYEGVFENGDGPIEIRTANNNGIILASLLYKVQGPLLARRSDYAQAWFTLDQDNEIRRQRCQPVEPIQVACTDCQISCEVEQSQPALAEYQYCQPASNAEWYPGCPTCLTSTAVTACQAAPMATPIQAAAGSQCRLPQQSAALPQPLR